MSITKKSSVLFDPISFNFNPFLLLQSPTPSHYWIGSQIEPEQGCAHATPTAVKLLR